MTVTKDDWPTWAETAQLWMLYADAMEPTRPLAAQRHMLTHDEFQALMFNPRITKAIARDDEGTPVGLAVYTNHLDAYDWIEPAYFARRWPDETKREAVFYVLFVVTADNAPVTTFTDLVNTVVDDIAAVKGVGALDWSQARVDRGLAKAASRIISRHAPLVDEIVDTQHFHTYQFEWDLKR